MKLNTIKRHFSKTTFEFTLHDLLPKDSNVVSVEQDDLAGLLYSLKLNTTHTPTYSFWQQIARETVSHVKSYTFRDEFFKLVRNDDIHLRLLSLHFFLLAYKVKKLSAD